MGRRAFTAAFKHEAVKLELEQRMTVAQASRWRGGIRRVARSRLLMALECSNWAPDRACRRGQRLKIASTRQ